MKTIFYHRVEIADATGIIGEEKTFRIEEIPVLDENDNYMVLKNSRFTVLSKIKKDYDTCLNDTSIRINTMDSVWGNRITYTRYSDRRSKACRIRAEIEGEIKRRFGFFVDRIDLSIIKD